MCGIVGYVGRGDALDFLVSGLRRLEYRGYDSSGVATLGRTGQIAVRKTVGRIDDLAHLLTEKPIGGAIGVGHTRWATHGPANNINAHPHLDSSQIVAVVHNGVIENFRPLRERLEAEGHVFHTATDSEVIAQLIAAALVAQADEGAVEAPLGGDVAAEHAPLVAAVQTALRQLQGTYGLAVVFRNHPDVIIAARLGSPLVVGVGDKAHFLASDASPLAGYTDKIVYLADHELAVITADSLRILHRDQGRVQPNIHILEQQEADVALGGFEHYMLKEIFEQPESIRNTMRGRLCLDEATAMFGGLNLTPQQLRAVNRVVITACGTSWHAGLVGEYLFEQFARLPVEVEYASELRYRNPPLEPNTLLFAITQSGETADTLAALREVKRKGLPTLAICNVVGSTIAQEADGGVYLHAGPEIGVASTKAFTSQCVALSMLALYIGRMRHMSFVEGYEMIDQLEQLPDQVARALETNDDARRIAEKYYGCNNFLYLGRQYNFPTALEGALKLKEISYIHAEGYPAAEMKHGPIALVDEHTPSVFIVPHGAV
ncbi:MAG: glutamine--fructose-6-phosphate transaminase (isomerizing), partial [Planctomycetales bacterium]|nr:glutamine--fructose-6-phosphate transaminase (isomerizing) [Planctomycetales bacterium]